MSTREINLRLRADASQWQAGFTAAQQTTAGFTSSLNGLLGRLPLVGSELTNISRTGTQVAGVFQGLSPVIGGLSPILAGVAGGFAAVTAAGVAAVGVGFKLTESYAQVGRQIALVSEQFGVSTENASALRVGMKEIGKDLTDLTPSFNIYLKNASEAAHGNTQMAATFKRFGIDAKEAIKDPNAAIEDLIKRLGEIQNPAERLDAAFKLAGRGAKDLALIAANAGGDLANLRKVAADIGESFSAEDADNAKKFAEQLALLELRIEGIGFKVARELQPTIGQAFTDFSGWLDRNQGEINQTASTVATAIGLIVKDIDSIGEALFGNEGAWQGWGAFVREQIAGVSADIAGIKEFIKETSGKPQDYTDVDPFTAFRKGADAYDRAWMATHDRTLYGDHPNPNDPYYQDPDPDNPYYQRLAGAGQQPARSPYRPQIGDAQKRGGGGRDPAADAMRKLQDRLAEIDRLAQNEREKVDQIFRLGVLGFADYVSQETAIEQKRYQDASAVLDKQYNEALSKKKGSSVAVADVNKRIEENEQQHAQTTFRIQTQSAQEQLERLKSSTDNYLAIQEEGDRRQIDSLRNSADQRTITYASAEEKINTIERAAYLRRDKAMADEQALYAQDTRQFQELSQRRALAKEQEASRVVAAEDRILAALQKGLDRLQQFDAQMRQLDAENDQARRDLNQANIDQLERLGANQAYIRQLRIQSLGGDYLAEKAAIEQRREADLAKAVGDERVQIEQSYQTRLLLLDQQYEAKRKDLLLQPLYDYAQKVHEIAGEVGDVFGTAFADIGQKGKNFFKDLRDGFNQLWQQIIHDFIQSQVRKIIESLFNPVYQQTGGQASGGGGFFSGLLGGLGRLFGLGSSATPGFNPNASSILSLLSGGGAINGGSPVDLSSADAYLRSIGGTPSGGTLTIPGGGSLLQNLLGGSNSLLTGGSFSTALAGIAPLAGLGLGAAVGGGQGLGGILGGAGGLLLGGAASAFLAPSLIAGLLGGGSVSILGPTGAALSTSFSGLGGAAIGFLTNPFTIAAGIGLIIGGFILGRNRVRHQSEQARDAAMRESLNALNQLLSEVQDGAPVQAAYVAALQIRNTYMANMQALPDGKTRNIALKDVSRLDAIIDKIRTTNTEGQFTADGARLINVSRPKYQAPFIPPHPELATGGINFASFSSAPFTLPTINLPPLPGVSRVPSSRAGDLAGALSELAAAQRAQARSLDSHARAQVALANELSRFVATPVEAVLMKGLDSPRASDRVAHAVNSAYLNAHPIRDTIRNDL